MSDNSAMLAKSPKHTTMLPLRMLLLLLLVSCMAYGVLKLDSPRVRSVVLVESGISQPLEAQPYETGSGKDIRHTLVVRLDYFLWQNGHIVIEPQDGCITRAGVKQSAMPSAVQVPLEGMDGCNEIILDLSHRLGQGSNELILEIAPQNRNGAQVYISPKLFGAHAASTLTCLCLFASYGVALLILARAAGLEVATSVILLLSFGTYALLLPLRPNLAYSNDLPGHILYIRYMVDGWLRPYGYNGWEHFHPPLYYFLAARMFAAFSGMASVVAPLTAVRGFSLFLYMAFCVYGLRTLSEAVRVHRLSYYIGVLLTVFWPMAPIVATRISNDIPTYAAWAAAFYYLTRWLRERKIGSLQAALVFTGLAIALKTSALLIMAVVGASLLIALAGGRLKMKELLQPGSMLAFAVLALGILANTGRLIHALLQGGSALGNYLSPGAEEVHPASYFLHFNLMDYIGHPAVIFEREPGFLNYFLKTMLYSESQLGGLVLLPALLNGLLLALLAIIAIAVIAGIRRERENAWWPYVLGVIIPLAGPFIFMLLKHYMFCQSFRFIVPMLIPLVVLYVRGMVAVYGGGMAGRALYWLGIYTGLGLVLGGIALNLYLYSHGQFI